MRHGPIAWALALGVLVLGTRSLDAQTAVTVDAQDFSFAPHEVRIAAGMTVRWINHDDSPHHVITETKLVDSGPLGPGQAFTFTFTQAGRFTYRCAIHPTMLGVITVQGP